LENVEPENIFNPNNTFVSSNLFIFVIVYFGLSKIIGEIK